jgi:hypothetical protein
MNSIRSKCALTSALVVLLLLSNLQAPSVLLSGEELSNHHGAGFWQDPCTWDGFLTGAGGVLCAFGNLGGCLSAVIGIAKAVKVDNCF